MIIITSKREGFRRCGVAHPARPVEWPDDRWAGDELAALMAEPMLTVELVEDQAALEPYEMEFDAAPLTGADAGAETAPADAEADPAGADAGAETAPADAEADPAGAGAMPVAKKTGRKKEPAVELEAVEPLS